MKANFLSKEKSELITKFLERFPEAFDGDGQKNLIAAMCAEIAIEHRKNWKGDDQPGSQPQTIVAEISKNWQAPPTPLQWDLPLQKGMPFCHEVMELQRVIGAMIDGNFGMQTALLLEHKFKLDKITLAELSKLGAEVNKKWGNEGDGELLSQKFERVIAVNAKRGYALKEWELMTTSGDRLMNETIIAVFELKTRFATAIPMKDEWGPLGKAPVPFNIDFELNKLQKEIDRIIDSGQKRSARIVELFEKFLITFEGALLDKFLKTTNPELTEFLTKIEEELYQGAKTSSSWGSTYYIMWNEKETVGDVMCRLLGKPRRPSPLSSENAEDGIEFSIEIDPEVRQVIKDCFFPLIGKTFIPNEINGRNGWVDNGDCRAVTISNRGWTEADIAAGYVNVFAYINGNDIHADEFVSAFTIALNDLEVKRWKCDYNGQLFSKEQQEQKINATLQPLNEGHLLNYTENFKGDFVALLQRLHNIQNLAAHLPEGTFTVKITSLNEAKHFLSNEGKEFFYNKGEFFDSQYNKLDLTKFLLK